MTPALARIRAATLLAQSQCPVCGAARTETIGGSRSPIAICVYRCTAEFEVDGNGEIIPMNVCPSGSYGAAARLNREARADAVRQAGGA